jgi:hypothetical protein
VSSWPVRLFGDCLSVALPIAVALAAGNAALTSRADAAGPVAPYRLSGSAQGVMPIPYWLDSRFTTSEARALRAAFAQWQTASGSRVTFEYMGSTSAPSASSDDGRNVVVRSSVALPRGRGSTLAVTTCRLADDGRANAGGVYADADIEIDFSGRVAWSTTGEPRKHDLQSVAAHEVGHLLGLEDVDDAEQMMYWLFQPGDVDRHDLHRGDLEGLTQAYPGAGDAQETLGTPADARGR